ncbi:hypothetical protein B0O80DRAFT_183310 [Mortierella sp. GBAus27b]|nr:hypothetical protein B0O80DRAFT_183310 [Mortierella sp. GBAus27b]
MMTTGQVMDTCLRRRPRQVDLYHRLGLVHSRPIIPPMTITATTTTKTMTEMTKGVRVIIAMPKTKTWRIAETPVVTHGVMVSIRPVSATMVTATAAAAATASTEGDTGKDQLLTTMTANDTGLENTLAYYLLPLLLRSYLWLTGVQSNTRLGNVDGSVMLINDDSLSTEANLRRKYFPLHAQPPSPPLTYCTFFFFSPSLPCKMDIDTSLYPCLSFTSAICFFSLFTLENSTPRRKKRKKAKDLRKQVLLKNAQYLAD